MKDTNPHIFEYLGEIWRDVTAIEFLMRCAIAKKDGDITKLPKPPYQKGKVYKEYPDSFSKYGFEEIAGKFNKYYPKLKIPQELIDLRNAMAHGLTAEVNKSGVTEIVKFKETKSGLVIEFYMPLNLPRVAQIHQYLKELRRWIAKEVDEGKR